LIATTAFAQSTPSAQNCCDEKPTIEVTGSAEMEIIPDEIFISVELQEWYDGKTKVPIEKLETDLFAAMQSLNIEPKDISLSDAGSNFYYRRWKSDDVLLTRSYTVLVHSAEMVIRVYDKLGEIRATNAYISKLSHSKIEEYRMQTKVNATKAAKNKAIAMLQSIDQNAGDAVLIREIDIDYIQPFEYSQIANVAIMEDYGGTREEYQSQLNYQKIKLRYEVFAVFEIVNK
jgi:uncharacterized protein YggE